MQQAFCPVMAANYHDLREIPLKNHNLQRLKE